MDHNMVVTLVPIYLWTQKIQVSEFWGAISCQGPGYEPCNQTFSQRFPQKKAHLKESYPGASTGQQQPPSQPWPPLAEMAP